MTYLNAVKYILKAPSESPMSDSGAALRRIWDHLGNPQKKLKYLRLAGSNGKTVCAEMLMSVFKDSPLKMGCLTTPLRSELCENIRINASHVSYADFAHYTETVYRAILEINKQIRSEAERAKDTKDTKDSKDLKDLKEMEKDGESDSADPADMQTHEIVLTQNEILLTAALLIFRDMGCALCLIESDHNNPDPTRFLSAPFAAAICGTIPSNNSKEIKKIRTYISHGIQEIVSAPQDQNAYHVISQTCAAINCRLTIPTKAMLEIKKLSLFGTDFLYKGKSYHIGLCGQFQVTNATVVLEILEMLARRGYSLSEEQIQTGLKRARIPAKFEILSVSPTIIADSTHSDVAIETVCASMADFRSVIGSSLRLCLPDEHLLERYSKVLEKHSYTIDKSIIFSAGGTDPSPHANTVQCASIRDTVTHALADLGQDEILLISGPYRFTAQIRYELLKKLGFK